MSTEAAAVAGADAPADPEAATLSRATRAPLLPELADYALRVELDPIDPALPMLEAAARAAADRFLYCLGEVAAEAHALEIELDDAIAGLQARALARQEQLAARRGWLESQLALIFPALPLRGKTKSVTLLRGTLGTRTRAGGFRVDGKIAAAWAPRFAPEAVEQRPHVDADKLKSALESSRKDLTINADGTVVATLAGGERAALPGVSFVKDAEVFYAKPA